MLVLSRKEKEVIRIGDNITIVVCDVHGSYVKLGIDAPKDVTIHRGEVYERIRIEQGEPNNE